MRDNSAHLAMFVCPMLVWIKTLKKYCSVKIIYSYLCYVLEMVFVEIPDTHSCKFKRTCKAFLTFFEY